MKQSSGWVAQNIDNLYDSQYGFQTTITTGIGTEVEVPWPSTGETQVYIRFPQDTNAYTANVRCQSSDFGWEFQVPAAESIGSLTVPAPIVVPPE